MFSFILQKYLTLILRETKPKNSAKNCEHCNLKKNQKHIISNKIYHKKYVLQRSAVTFTYIYVSIYIYIYIYIYICICMYVSIPHVSIHSASNVTSLKTNVVTDEGKDPK